MLRFVVCCFILNIKVWMVQAQANQVFQFPEGYSSDNYHPSAVVYKLKSSVIPQTKDRIAVPDEVLSPQLCKVLRAKEEPHPMFAPESYVFNDRSSDKIPTRIKQLSLIYILEVGEGIDLEAAINQVRQDPAVVYAEPLYRHYPLNVPNDPLAVPSAQRYHLDMINAYQAWAIEQGDTSLTIGVVDNGTKVSYADLAANFRKPRFIDNGLDLNNDLAGATLNSQFDSDDNVEVDAETVPGSLHGTAVALCAAAVPDNALGTAGTGYNTRVLPVKVAPDDQLGIYTNGYDGIIYAAKQGCKVINLSWGRKGLPSQAELDILESVFYGQDAVLVAAAGNDNTKDFFYPASYEEIVLSVASLQSNGTKANTSTFNSRVDICAPGDRIIVSNAPPASGTSFAAPLVAGAVALVRGHFPDLNASQTVARIKTTTQDIYLGTNERYRGYLGTGLLDMHQALVAPNIALSLEAFTFENGQRGGFMYAGGVSRLVCDLQNHMDALPNLTVTLKSNSPYVEILDGTANYGSIAANTKIDNDPDPFRVRIATNTPANSIVLLELTYQSGTYEYTEEWPLLLNPGHIDINNMQFTIGDQGQLAIYNNDFAQMAGITGKDGLVLSDAGLIIGLNPDQVSSAGRQEGNLFDSDFTINQPLSPSFNIAQQFLTTTSKFEDIANNSQRIGLAINQITYAWTEPDLEDMVIVEYQIRNLSEQKIEELHVGLYADWNLNQFAENRADWDEQRSMGYVYDPKFQGQYAAIRLLSPHDQVSYYAFDDLSAINFFNGFNDEEKFQVISGGVAAPQAGLDGLGKNVAHCLAGTLYEMEVGEVRKIAFAFILEDDALKMQITADAAEARYREFNRSPLPVISDLEVCKGETINLQPQGGRTFEFYRNNPDLNPEDPIFKGGSLRVREILDDQTYYIVNVDSVFKSDAKQVDIDVKDHQTDFALENDSLDFDVSPVLQLFSTSEGAVSWNWQITRPGGQVNTDIEFLEDTDAQIAAPLISFKTFGQYQVKLITQNSLGCQDSLQQEIWVLRDLSNVVTALEDLPITKLEIFPNPSSDILWVAMQEVPPSAQVSLEDALGRLVWSQSFEQPLEPKFAIPLTNVQAGLYYLKVQVKDKVFVRKVLVQ